MATAQAEMNPYQIFARARQAWEAQRYPSGVSYTIRVAANDRGALVQRHYHASWSPDTNDVSIDPVSDEERAHPYKPPGGFNFYGISVGGREGTGIHGGLIGVPVLSPAFAFGIAPFIPAQAMTSAQLVAEIRAEYGDPSPQKISQLEAHNGLKTIAIVTSTARDYRITLAGVEPYGGHQDYHLILQPQREPDRYRLRELWLNAQTYLPDRLRNAGNFTDGRTAAVPWDVRFAHALGATFIQSEAAMHPVQGAYGHEYADYTVSFDGIAVQQTGATIGLKSFSILGTTELLEPETP